MARNHLAKATILGVVVGAVAGILLAPKSGKETQQFLKRKANGVKGDTFDKVRETEAKVVDRIEAFKEAAADLRGEAYEESQKLLVRGEMIKHDLQEAAERISKNSKQMSDETREDIKRILKDGGVFVKDIEKSTRRIISGGQGSSRGTSRKDGDR